jgi:hypothetical protein
MAAESNEIVVTNTLKAEIVSMAVLDLNKRFFYRFTEPFTTPWQSDGLVTFLSSFSLSKGFSSIDWFLMGKYKTILFNSKNVIGEDKWQKIKWLEQIDKIEVVDRNFQALGDK